MAEAERSAPATPTDVSRAREPGLVERVERHVRGAPEVAHGVASLAAAVGMRRSSFAKDFAAESGLSPMRFVQAIRLELARELLESSALRVEEVAGRVGFRDRSHFSRAFRASFGSSPQQYRSTGRADDV